MRINKCIELLESGQPVYTTTAPTLTYAAGRDMSQTWADMLTVEFEHHSFDTTGLAEFMRGLRDGGPTPSGHPTPTVIATLPANSTTTNEVLSNAWQSRHILATGVHGLLQTHVRGRDAVEAFVATARYPFQTIGLDKGIPEGLRGSGGQAQASPIWGLTQSEYVRRADPWPLNPKGELMLGLKIEDRHGLADADAAASTPGIAFAEWGPDDMGMSFGDPDLYDGPYPSHLDEAREAIMAACQKADIAFYCGWRDPAMSEEERARLLLEEIGAKILVAPTETFAEIGRGITGLAD